MMLKLSEKYKQEAIPQMMQKFSYRSSMAVPKILKAVVNTGFGREVAGKTPDEQRKIADLFLGELALMVGQRPVKTLSKKSIASFKIRQGLAIGAKITLRGKRMREFLEKLIHVVLPRSRDFQGIPEKSLDKGGNLTIAIKEHIAFPEILPEKAKNIFGLEITIITNAKSREEALELFKLLGFPIQAKI